MESSQLKNEMHAELIRLDRVSHDYGQFSALRDVSLTVNRREVHAIIGEHGAGKSTLATIMSGLLRPRSGRIYYDGKKLPPLTPKLALKLGIRMVYQQVCLNESFSVAENLFYSTRFTRSISWNLQRRMIRAAGELLQLHGFRIDPTIPVRRLSLSDRTVVDILKQIYLPPRLLILDEALEKLSSSSLEIILRLLVELKDQGMAIVFITHKIDDIYSFSDKVSIVRNGQLALSDDITNIDKISLIRLAYTQMSLQPESSDANLEFYRFLKYSEAILQRLPVSVVVTDNSYCVKMMNNYFQEHFRVNWSEVQGLPLEKVLSGRNKSAFEDIRSAFDTRLEQMIYRVSLQLPDRQTLNNIKTLPILDGQQVIGHILIIEDISQYDQLQKQVILSEKLASVGLLAAGVAHEINNPLEIVYNYIRFLKRNNRNSSLQKPIDRLHDEISNIASIVGNLSTFSDSRNQSREDINLNETIKRIFDLIRHNAAHKHVHIHFIPEKTEPRLRINGNELRQVILNLVVNSIEAMPDGGTISVRTTSHKEDGKEMVSLRIADTGPGILEENLSDIFLPFFSTKKAGANNMGLGLSITYTIVTKYGGRISVQNLPERGCEFTVVLPAL